MVLASSAKRYRRVFLGACRDRGKFRVRRLCTRFEWGLTLAYQVVGSDPEFRKRVHRRPTRYSRQVPRTRPLHAANLDRQAFTPAVLITRKLTYCQVSIAILFRIKHARCAIPLVIADTNAHFRLR